jgi:hypothetical protein
MAAPAKSTAPHGFMGMAAALKAAALPVLPAVVRETVT